MRRPVLLLASSIALAVAAPTLSGCGRGQTTAAAPLACEPLPGAEALLQAEAARLIVVGAASPLEAQAFLLTACAALQNGERVAALLPAGPEGEGPRATLLGWAQQGAAVIVAALPAVDPTAPEAAQPALAQAIAAAPQADRTIALLDADSAARRPLGLSRQTWEPAGALLPEDRAVTLRAMEAPGGEARLSFAPFEDVPEQGASRAYDGLITLPAAQPVPAPPAAPSPDAPNPDALRGR